MTGDALLSSVHDGRPDGTLGAVDDAARLGRGQQLIGGTGGHWASIALGAYGGADTPHLVARGGSRGPGYEWGEVPRPGGEGASPSPPAPRMGCPARQGPLRDCAALRVVARPSAVRRPAFLGGETGEALSGRRVAGQKTGHTARVADALADPVECGGERCGADEGERPVVGLLLAPAGPGRRAGQDGGLGEEVGARRWGRVGGVRADAEVVPPGASCVSAGGPAAVPVNWLASWASRP